MYDNGGTINTTGQQFVEGMPVFDAAGDKVGTVSQHDVQGGYLIVQKGWLFPQDVYVPLNAIERNDADGVYLRYYKDDLKNQDWSAPPSGTLADSNVMASSTTDAVTRDEDVRVPLMEEELVVGKQEREIGRVHLHKDVVEEEQTITQPVTHEEVYVERVPVQGEYTAPGPDAFTERDIDVPVMGEELVAGKRAVVTEEVHLRKEAVTEEQQVSDTVRKERVTVQGGDEVIGADETDLGTATKYGADDAGLRDTTQYEADDTGLNSTTTYGSDQSRTTW